MAKGSSKHGNSHFGSIKHAAANSPGSVGSGRKASRKSKRG